MQQDAAPPLKGEKTVYTSCLCNCGSNSQCVLKAHVKDGVVVAVEPDDRYNTGVGREDEVLSEADLIKVRLQRRPCTRGLVFHKYIYHPNRVLYPLKRDPNSKRGEGKYIRISWDEALTTIANKMKEIRDKYGPYSIITPYLPNLLAARLFSFWGAGVDSWGWCSYDATRLTTHLVSGGAGWECAEYSSGSAADMLANSKLIVLWGLDACTGSSGPGYQFAWFLKLARERGKRVIVFDPRYSPTAEVLADQWITIKPGTDSAMYMALAYVYRSHYWAQAVLLLDKVRSGELSEKDYMRMVGWRADSSLLKDFNPKILFWGGFSPHGSDHLVTACESSNYQVPAMEKMEFIVTMHSIITPTAKYADIILPARDWMWEEKNIVKNGPYGGFECINYCAGVVDPPGEVKPRFWVYVKLAERLGIDPRKFFQYYTTDENWDNDWERYQQDLYQGVVEYYKKSGVSLPPWEEFAKGKFINCDELDDEPFTGFDEQMKKGKPFKTASGKIELYSNYVANEANRGKGEHYDPLGRIYDNLASDWGSLTPMPVYQTAVRGMDDPLVKKYPLMLLAPHGRYRVHYLFWEHPWLRGQVYQHRVWISTTDAKARGIKDDDLIQVYNDRGKVVMPAYVTSRIMPGLVVIRHGGKYDPDESGIDFGGSPSTLLGGDFESCISPAKAANVVQVETYQGGLK